MFGKARSIGNSANREGGGLVEHVKGALIAGRDSWEDDAGLALEA